MNHQPLRRLLLSLGALIMVSIACSPGASIPFLSSGERPLLVCATRDTDEDGEFTEDDQKGIYVLTNLDGDVQVERFGNNDDYFYSRPRISPDGKRVAYLVIREDTDDDGDLTLQDEQSLFIANLDGSREVEVEPPDDVEPESSIYFGWSGDGDRLVLLYREPEASAPYLIFTVNSEGHVQEEIDYDDYMDNDLLDFTTLVSPDGEHRVWFAGAKEWSISAADEDEDDAEEIDNLPDEGGYYVFLGWSPDSQSILVGAADYGLGSTLYVVDPNGDDPVQITDEEEAYYLPDGVWSPDGSRIAYIAPASDSPDPHRLYLVNPDGEDRERLLDGEYGWFACLDW